MNILPVQDMEANAVCSTSVQRTNMTFPNRKLPHLSIYGSWVGHGVSNLIEMREQMSSECRTGNISSKKFQSDVLMQTSFPCEQRSRGLRHLYFRLIGFDKPSAAKSGSISLYRSCVKLKERMSFSIKNSYER